MILQKFNLFSLALLWLLASCSGGDYDGYQGVWRGTYTGDDNGTWNAAVDGDGYIDGSLKSDSFPNFSFALQGTVQEDGTFDASANIISSTVYFSGKLNDKNANGIWENVMDSISGTWEGKKD